MTWDLLLRNAQYIENRQIVSRDIAIKNGTVVAHFAGGTASIDQADTTVDVKNDLVLPGCVDAHTHLFDPGYPLREDFSSGTAAAAKGGVTTLIDMPCSSQPTIRSVADAEVKLRAIESKAHVDYALWGGITGEEIRSGRTHEVAALAQWGVVGFKVYMTSSLSIFQSVSHAEMVEAFTLVAKTGRVAAVHAEDPDLCDYFTKKMRNAGRTDPAAWAEARLHLAEEQAIAYSIQAAEKAGCRLHIVHMSTAQGVRLVAAAKQRNLPITAETCPQYLLLTAEEALSTFASIAKCAPPLRTTADQASLWEGLRDGTVDFVATDHAPFDWDTEKCAGDIWTAFSGFPGLETLLPALLTAGYHEGRLPLHRVQEILCEIPARQYGIFPKKGHLGIGADADFVVIDLNRPWIYSAKDNLSLAKYSPFDGRTFVGKPLQTWVRGKLVYDASQGVLAQPGTGEWIRPG